MPILPTTASPELSPRPTFRSRCLRPSSFASCSKRAFNGAIACTIARAERQPSSACFGSSRGAFQNAIIQSPIYLSMVPFLARIMSVRGVKSLLISTVSPSASNNSEILVNPLTSQNKSVISRFAPPSVNKAGSSTTCSTMAGDKYFEKASLVCRLSASSLA